MSWSDAERKYPPLGNSRLSSFLSNKSMRGLIILFIIFALSMVGVAGFVTKPIHAAGSYNNADIATDALSYPIGYPYGP